MFRDSRLRFLVVWLLVGLPMTGCSVFGGSGGEETGAAQNQRITDTVEQAIHPLRKEVDDLRVQTDDNKREIAVLKTEVEVIKRDVSRRPVITPTDGDARLGSGDGSFAGPTGGSSGTAPDLSAADAERIQRQKAVEERIAREKAETERLLQERAEAERRIREQGDAERLAREKADAERLAREKADAERLAREKADAERLAREKTDAERLAREKTDAERLAREKTDAERLAREKADAERLAREKAGATGDGTAVSTAKAGPTGTPPMQIPADATPEEKAAYLTNQLRTTSDVEAVARQMRDVSHIVAPALVKMLSDSDITAKFRAEKALSFLDPRVVTPLLQDHLKKPQTQLAAIKILGNLGDPQGTSSLAPFLSHENRDLRFYAADSLVKLKDKRAIPHLIEYLKGADTAKSAIAYDTLRQRTGQSFPFPFFGSKEEREKYAGAWEQWWKEKGDKFEFK